MTVESSVGEWKFIIYICTYSVYMKCTCLAGG